MKFKEIILFALVFCIYFASAQNCDKCDCTGKYLYNCSCFKERYNNCIQKDISLLFDVAYNKIEEIFIRDISITLDFAKNLNKLKKITFISCNINIIDKNSFNNITGMTELTIQNNEIKIFSDDAFEHHEKLHYLNLKNNSLREFPDKNLNNLPGLFYFNLGFNEISELSSKLFSYCKQLQEIYLNKNKIGQLPNDIFEGLTDLKEINLADNKLEELPDGIFSNLPRLESIYLQNNKITSIKVSSFKNSQQVQKIHLEGNKILHFDWAILNFPQLNYINIPDSSIKCDCKAKQYINIYKGGKILGDIQCSNTKKLSDLIYEDFACAPKILNCIVVKEINSTKLSCMIYGDPLPEIIWRLNDTEVFNNTLYNLKSDKVNEDIFWANLTILNKFRNFSGLYKIEARNNGGHVNYPLKIIAEPEDNMQQSNGYTGWVVGFSAGVLCVVTLGAVGALVYTRMGGRHEHTPVETVEPKKNDKKKRSRSNCYSIDLDEVVTTKPSSKPNYIPRDEKEKSFLEQHHLLEVQGINDKNRDSCCSTGSDGSEHSEQHM